MNLAPLKTLASCRFFAGDMTFYHPRSHEADDLLRQGIGRKAAGPGVTKQAGWGLFTMRAPLGKQGCEVLWQWWMLGSRDASHLPKKIKSLFGTVLTTHQAMISLLSISWAFSFYKDNKKSNAKPGRVLFRRSVLMGKVAFKRRRIWGVVCLTCFEGVRIYILRSERLLDSGGAKF